MRRIAAVVALLPAAVWAPAVPAAPPRTQVWSITTDVARPVDLQVAFMRKPGRAGAAMVAAAEGSGRALSVNTAMFLSFGPGAPQVYGADTPACDACETVWTAFGRSGYLVEMRGTPARVRMVVAATDVDVEIKAGKGWRVAPMPATAFRHVAAADADSVGADVVVTRAGRFTETSLPGGRHGSVAYASLPCSSKGAGEARLTGGLLRPVLRCPATRDEDPYDAAPGATTWRLSGDATGADGRSVRLAVLDLPRA